MLFDSVDAFRAAVKRLIRTVVGVLWAAVWILMLWRHLNSGAVVPVLALVFAFLAIVGAFIADPGTVKAGFVVALEMLKVGLDAMKAYLPTISIGRKTDPQPPKEGE